MVWNDTRNEQRVKMRHWSWTLALLGTPSDGVKEWEQGEVTHTVSRNILILQPQTCSIALGNSLPVVLGYIYMSICIRNLVTGGWHRSKINITDINA